MQEADHHRAVFDRPSVLRDMCLRDSYWLAGHRRGLQEALRKTNPIRDVSQDSKLFAHSAYVEDGQGKDCGRTHGDSLGALHISEV